MLYVTAGFSPLSPRLIDSFEARFIMQRLKAAGVRFAPTTWIRSIGDAHGHALRCPHRAERTLDGIDAVVLSTARVPLDGLAQALEGKVAQLFTIGDALAARPLAAATYEGQKFARCIGEPGAPATVRKHTSALMVRKSRRSRRMWRGLRLRNHAKRQVCVPASSICASFRAASARASAGLILAVPVNSVPLP